MASFIAMLAAFISGCGSFKSERVVGKDIRSEDITEFYYTDTATTNPPRFQRYHFHTEDGKYLFTHEKREGDKVFLTEEDITVTGTLELTEEEWAEFYGLLCDGKVTKRSDSTDLNDGGSRYLFLYWKGDKDDYQVFSFAPDRLYAFEQLCLKLKDREMNRN